MKALSIRNPWGWLIVNGYKDIENRSWRTNYRGRIYIHAGLKADPNDFQSQREYVRSSGIVIPDTLATGAVIGEATLTDCIDSSDSPWFCGRYGFCLSDPVAYDQPIPYKGQLNLFEINERMICQT